MLIHCTMFYLVNTHSGIQLHFACKRNPRDQLPCPHYTSLSQYFDKTANGQADREDTQTFPKCRIPHLIQNNWMSLPRRLGLHVISTLRPSQTTAANAWAFKMEKIPHPCAHFSLFQAVFTLWSLSTNSDTSCKCFHCSTESFLSGSNMWYQFIILDNATRNPLALKIKWELCNLTLKSPCPFFFFFKKPKD